MSLFKDTQKTHEIICKLDQIIGQNRAILNYLERLDEAVPTTINEMEKTKAVNDFMKDFINEYKTT